MINIPIINSFPSPLWKTPAKCNKYTKTIYVLCNTWQRCEITTKLSNSSFWREIGGRRLTWVRFNWVNFYLQKCWIICLYLKKTWYCRTSLTKNQYLIFFTSPKTIKTPIFKMDHTMLYWTNHSRSFLWSSTSFLVSESLTECILPSSCFSSSS